MTTRQLLPNAVEQLELGLLVEQRSPCLEVDQLSGDGDELIESNKSLVHNLNL